MKLWRSWLICATGIFWSSVAEGAVVSTYSPTNDVWKPPVAQGRWLADTRLGAALGPTFVLGNPNVALALGLGQGLEAGVSGSYSAVSAMGSTYLKYQLPFRAGSAGFGIVSGGNFFNHLQGGVNTASVGLEGVMFIPVGEQIDVDLGVGYGYWWPGLGTTHFNATTYWASGFGTYFADLDFTNSLVPLPKIGVFIPLTRNMSMDLSGSVFVNSGTVYTNGGVGLTAVF